ncbi:MAG: LCP family protein [Candidatus Contubernalis sp.]|nr:LCP family protein [Candidatus Contubernalis sp.]
MKRKIFLAIVVIMAVFTLAGAFKGYMWWNQVYDPLSQVYNPTDKSAVAEENKDKPTVILVLGLDQRGQERSRADSIMVFSMHWESQCLSVVSIPRDTRVKIPERGYEKINHAYAYGGVDLTIKTVEDLLGTQVDNYITTNFNGFEKMVDILGGVEIDVEKRMIYRASDVNINLASGLQRLDGKKALQYVRFRNDAAGDLGRVERQQQFVKALINEAFSYKNVVKLPSFLDEAVKHFKTDMELSKMQRFMLRLQAAKPEDIKTATLPGTPKYIDGVSYVVLDEEEKNQMINEYILWKTN